VNLSSLKLHAYKALNIHRGEGSRILTFVLLQFFLSLVVGMISSVVDPLFMKHGMDAPESFVLSFLRMGHSLRQPRIIRLSFFLYGLSSFLLAVLGLLYTGVTDRFDKRKLFLGILYVTLAICVLGGMLIFVDSRLMNIPGVYSVLFVFRFSAGIVLLMVFWDIAPFYFDARQGKRLFPLLASGGAAGYAAGSFIVAPLSSFVPLNAQLFVIAAFTLPCILGFLSARRRFPILDSPRYKKMTLRSEIREGIFSFSGSSFLRLSAASTVVFGLLAGLIIFTYNAVVHSRVTTGAATANLMGLQRAAATMLQATVLTKVMSQSSLGGQHRKELAFQVLFLVLGVAAFIVSMVGVADFTRQIQIALLSPAAVAIFAFVPSRYRGRIMALNNLVLAPLGIFIVSVIVILAGSLIDPVWFIYLIAALMVARLVLNHFLNRKYVSLLSENLMSGSKIDLVKIKDNARSIIDNPILLEKLQNEMEKQSLSVKVFLSSRLASEAETAEDLERLRPFFPDDAPETIRAAWIEALARVGFESHEEEILKEEDSPSGEIRTAARLAVLRSLRASGKDGEFRERLSRLTDGFEAAVAAKDAGKFEEYSAILLRFEAETGERFIRLERDSLDDELLGIFLSALAAHPTERYFPFVLAGLGKERFRKQTTSCLKAMPEKTLLEHEDIFTGLPPSEILSILEELVFSHPEFSDRESVGLLKGLFEPFETPGLSLKETLGILHASGGEMVRALLILALGPKAAPNDVAPAFKRIKTRLLGLFPQCCALLRETDGIAGSRYHPLIAKLVREETTGLLLVLAALTAAEMKNDEDRDLACGIIRDLYERTAEMSQSAMEFIDTKIEDEVRKPLLLYYENLTVDEKHLRMRPYLRGLNKGPGEIIGDWAEALTAVGDEIGAEILNEFRSLVGA